MGWSNVAATLLEANTLIIETGTAGSGIFVYNGTPMAGNLVGSWTSAAGTDPYGNAYPSGISAVGGLLSGTSITGASIGSSSLLQPSISNGTMTDTVYSLDTSSGAILVYSSTTTTVTHSATGTGTFSVPSGIANVNVQAWGGGGSGGAPANLGGGGGGGGEFAQEMTLTVTPLETLNWTVGAGSSSSANGGDTFLQRSGTDLVRAHGGQTANSTGGVSGGSGSTNSVHFNGGSGANGATFVGNGSGGGAGSSAGTSSIGNDGSPGSAGIGSHGGAGGAAPSGGGSGGKGGDQDASSGVNGSAPGGGGGGAPTGAFGSGNGADGKMIISYTSAQNLIGSWAGIAGTDQFGNSYPQGFFVSPAFLGAYAPTTTSAETWHSLAYSNGWADFGGGQQPGRYKLDATNRVQLDGDIKGGTFANGTVMFTLPAGYRPVNPRIFQVQPEGNGTGTFTFTVNTNGQCTLENITGAAPSILGLTAMSFPLD